MPGVEPSDLADTSAFARVPHHLGMREALIEPVSNGVIAYCDVTRLEMGMTARNVHEHEALGVLLARLPQVRNMRDDYDRAWEVQRLLATTG